MSEETVQPTGWGAATGVIVGGVLTMPMWWPYFFLGMVVGALLMNEVEYQYLRYCYE